MKIVDSAERRELARALMAFMSGEGLSFPKIPTFRELLTVYFDYKRRLIRIAPREVSRSVSADWGAHESDIQVIEEELRIGRDMTPRLGRAVVEGRANSNDRLLNTSGFHHLHLGARQPDGSVPGGDDVLLLFVGDQCAYLLGIVKHGDWSNEEVRRRLHAEWPETVNGLVLPGITTGTQFNDQDSEELRKAGVTVVHAEVDGSVLFPPGGGMTVAGGSVLVAMQCDAVLTATKSLKLLTAGDIREFQAVLYDLDISVRCSGPPLCCDITAWW